MQIVRRMIPGDAICDFIGRLALKSSTRGIRQGGPLSSELLNCYLHWVLDRWWTREFLSVPMLRVADDILALDTTGEPERLHSVLEQRMRSAGMHLKGNSLTSSRDLSRGQAIEWLGYQITRSDSQLRVQRASKSWDKLEDHLRLAWEEPIPPLAANESLRGWIAQQGAAYDRGQTRAMYRRMREYARGHGFTEIPSREELASLWYQAYIRDWVPRRREARLARASRCELATPTGGADGFADQDCGNSVDTDRCDGARPTGAPSQLAPIRREVFIYTDGAYKRDRSNTVRHGICA